MTDRSAPEIRRQEIATEADRVVRRIAGHGPPMFLVHGGAGSWTHRLRVPDPPGFGAPIIDTEGVRRAAETGNGAEA